MELETHAYKAVPQLTVVCSLARLWNFAVMAAVKETPMLADLGHKQLWFHHAYIQMSFI